VRVGGDGYLDALRIPDFGEEVKDIFNNDDGYVFERVMLDDILQKVSKGISLCWYRREQHLAHGGFVSIRRRVPSFFPLAVK